MTSQSSETTLACNIHAIPQERREEHQANARRIFSAVQEVRELPTGYAMRLPNETELLHTLITFISYERLCCPFFRFELVIEAEQGPVWFHLTGTADIKPFLQDQGFLP